MSPLIGNLWLGAGTRAALAELFAVESTSSTILVDNTTFFGIESELEGAPFKLNDEQVLNTDFDGTPLPKTVSIHKDGSLRNNGVEFVTTPCRGKILVDAITSICNVASRYQLKTSNRAGVHVHVDMSRTTLDQYSNFLKLYTLIEPVVFYVAGQHRGGSIYCKSWYEGCQNDELVSALRLITSGTWVDIPSRYSGLNINSTRKYGTLEFRHMESSTDKDAIIRWVNFIATIRTYALTTDQFTPDRVRNTIPEMLLRDIFGPGYQAYVPPDFMSYFYQTCVPLWFDLFAPLTPVSLSWTRSKEEVKAHKGYTTFVDKWKARHADKPKKIKQRNYTIAFDEPLFAFQNQVVEPAPIPEAPQGNILRTLTEGGRYCVYNQMPPVTTRGPAPPSIMDNGRTWVSVVGRSDLQVALSTAAERAEGHGPTVYRYYRRPRNQQAQG